MPLLPFRARARTVDHLGREQIADCPTAVSELWKNAYDAYARRVALHVFDSTPPIAAIVDDGHGMSVKEFVGHWLMLGTESKAGQGRVSPQDRNGLPERPRQGQKGIGRLSVAYLGPTVLVLTRRRHCPFVAALIDWRLFQNPYLTLDDVRVPLEEFDRPASLPSTMRKLFDGLVSNVWGASDDPEHAARVADAWKRYSADEASTAHGEPSTADAIVNVAISGALEQRHLEVWPCWRDESDSGTALYIFDTIRALSVWTDNSVLPDDPEVETVKEQLEVTLRGFVDPYNELGGDDFEYEASAHRGSRASTIVSSAHVFGREDLASLEHSVVGSFDERGMFTGHVRAWGKELGAVTVPPHRPPPQSGVGYVGPFQISFGTFELDPKNSTHSAEYVADCVERARKESGLALYRDGIRVQPYGRPENDFFHMEERRSLNAGREFWSHRRTFGAVSITRNENPRLRDKAGREGLIDNQAAREFRILVEGLLKTLARRYFGSDSTLRQKETDDTKAAYAKGQAAANRVRRRTIERLRASLRSMSGELEACLAETHDLLRVLREQGASAVDHVSPAALDLLRARRAALRLPPRPRRLKPPLEEQYRRYRDQYADLTATLEAVDHEWRGIVESSSDPESVVRSTLARHQKMLSDAIIAWRDEVYALLDGEQRRWQFKSEEDGGQYYALAAPLIDDVIYSRRSLRSVLEELDGMRERLFAKLSPEYSGYIAALAALSQGEDLDEAVRWATDEQMDIAQRIDQWQSLAQMGITVEIIGHELNEAAAQVSRNLQRFPKSSRDTEAFKLAAEGFRALVHRLEFLSPLRLSGTTFREPISGSRIEEYVRTFFAAQLTERGASLEASATFRHAVIHEYPHRILPVFVNLINNALYWVTFAPVERKIRLDRVGNVVFVSDSGPGVDPDDVDDLFQVFFSRRVNGRGIGLYLCRVNLSRGKHTIRYVVEESEKLLSGANFAIEFKGIEHD